MRNLYLFGLFLFFCSLGAPPSAYSKTEEVDSQFSYRFLGGNQGDDEGMNLEEDAELEGVPVETAQEIKERLQIRNVLRLVDGDAVQVSEEIRAQMVGVDMPEYEGIDGQRKYYEFAEKTKEWLMAFMDNPEEMIDQYEGLGSKVKYNDQEHGNYLFYYMYVPKQFLEDVRKGQLNKFDKWLKGKENKLKEFNAKYGDRADITGMGIEDLPDKAATSEESEFMMKEKKFYYPEGGVRREELRRDGKLMLVREYNQQGHLIDEVFYNSNR